MVCKYGQGYGCEEDENHSDMPAERPNSSGDRQDSREDSQDSELMFSQDSCYDTEYNRLEINGNIHMTGADCFTQVNHLRVVVTLHC